MSKVRKMKIIYEGARKLYAEIIFRKHNQHFKLLSSRKIYTLSHETKYRHVENQICLSQAVFT